MEKKKKLTKTLNERRDKEINEIKQKTFRNG